MSNAARSRRPVTRRSYENPFFLVERRPLDLDGVQLGGHFWIGHDRGQDSGRVAGGDRDLRPVNLNRGVKVTMQVQRRGRAVEAELEAIESSASRFRPDSELSRLNRAAGSWTSVSPLLLQALALGIRGAALTGGAVDRRAGRHQSLT